MKRVLLYHATPIVSAGFFWNVGKLLEVIEDFDYVRIAVATGEPINSDEGRLPLLPLEYVRSMFPKDDRLRFAQFANDPNYRESISFEWLLKEAEKLPVDVSYYAHSKGVTRGNSLPVYLWTSKMYQELFNFVKVEGVLKKFPIAGSFKRYRKTAAQWPHFPKESIWHYSGTFFAFKNSELFSRQWQKYLKLDRYAVEAYLSLFFSAPEAGCLFAENAGNLYDLRYLQKLGLLNPPTYLKD